MYDLLIKNGLIIDGSGSPPRRGDIAAADGKIAEIGETIDKEAKKVIQAEGRYVTPGFIDIHRHGDAKVFESGFGEIELRQGITTIVNGQCGLSVVPCPKDRKKREEMFQFLSPIVGTVNPDLEFTTFAEYAALVEKQPLRLNCGCCVGNGSTRTALLGFGNEPLTRKNIRDLQDSIRASLDAGALGVTMGIVYAPECNYSMEEFIEVLSPMKEYNVPLVTHVRGEGDILHDSLREVIAIAKAVGVHLHVSHLKMVGKHNWGHGLDKAFQIFEEARQAGVEITYDAYPFTAGATQMIQYLPPDYLDGGTEEMVKRLKDPKKRARLIEILKEPQDYFENMLLASGWDKTIITSVTKQENRKYVGLTVTDFAKQLGKDPYNAAFDLLADENCLVGMVNFTASEEDNRRIIKDPYSNIISDSLYTEGGLPHPRVYSAFPRVLKTFVREENLFPIETAVHKITKKAADVYGLTQKGLLAQGMDGDFVIFDLNNIDTKSDYTDSMHLATGFDYVIVNGEITVEKDELKREVTAGKFIKK